MIILIRLVYIVSILSFSFSQVNIQLSQSSNLAKGNQPNSVFPNTSEQPDTSIYTINENIFDIGLSYNKFYLNTKVEYSKSPVFGIQRTEPEDMFHSYYLEYLGDRLNLKLGNIYSNYTRGLILNTYKDESTDFDNSVLGLELSYKLLDWMRLYAVYGSDTYESRTNSILQLNDLYFDHHIKFFGSEFSPMDDLTFNLQYMNQELIVDEEDEVNFLAFYSNTPLIMGRYINDNLVGFMSDDITEYNINSNKIGSSVQTYLFGIDIYAEYVINKYTRLDPGVVVGEELDGSLFYASLYADVFNIGVTYEFKRYDSPYYIKTVSSAPFGYKESSFVLQSRLSHLMNFVNEIGNQFDVLYPIGESLMLNFNLSTARRIHPSNATIKQIELSYDASVLDLDGNDVWDEGEEFVDDDENGIYDEGEPFIDTRGLQNMNDAWSQTSSSADYEYQEPPALIDIITMSKDHFSYAFWPYRQFYMGLSGYMFNDKLDFNIGIDLFEHIKDWGEGDFSGIIFNDYDYDFDQIESSVHITVNDYWDGIIGDYNSGMEDAQTLIDLGYWTQEEAELEVLNGLLLPEGVILSSINEVEQLNEDFRQASTDSLESYIEGFQDNHKWHYTHESAITIPTKLGWNFGGGSSILLSLEKQWREIEKNQDIVYEASNSYNDITASHLEKSDETYISVSYKTKIWNLFKGNIIGNTFTLFYNNEKYQRIDYENNSGNTIESINKKSGNWNGVQWTLNIKKSSLDSLDFLLSNSKLSIFYGSQRGGLICANGVCAIQPEFIDGVKFSFMKTF